MFHSQFAWNWLFLCSTPWSYENGTEDRIVSDVSSKVVNVTIGSTVELSCNLAPGSAQPTRIEWSRDRRGLPPTAFKKNNNNLELTNVQPEDAGKYLCEAFGPLGISSQNVLLVVQSKPSRVQQVVGRRPAVIRRRQPPSSRSLQLTRQP